MDPFKPTLYVASPLGFSESCRPFMDNVLIPRLNMVASTINPWYSKLGDLIPSVKAIPHELERISALHDLDMMLGNENERSIDHCQGIFAVLDGTDVDSGVAAEIGYGVAKGKKVLGYRGDFRLASENLGTAVNLQVQYFIERSGGYIISSIDDIPEAVKQLFYR